MLVRATKVELLVALLDGAATIASAYCKHIYITSWIPGFARDPLSRYLSPSLSRPSLPSLLFVPAFYPPSLGLPGFAQDNCIPEILFKPWCLVTLKFSPLTPPPPPSDGVGVTWFGYFVGIIFFLSTFRQFVKFPALLKFWPPQPPRDAGPPGVGWVNICLIDFLDIHGLTDTGWLKAAKTTSLRRQIHCDVICHTTARRRSWQLSPDSEIGPSDPTLPGHSWGQFLVGTIPRSIRICVPNLVMIGPAVWPPILDRHTHTHTDRQTDRICII